MWYCTLGLGKKNVSCLEDGSADELDMELLTTFPKLEDVGGYELLRIADKGRSLEVNSLPPDGYTASYLKEVVRQAKVYIRPIQRNLATEQVNSTGVGYVCLISAHNELVNLSLGIIPFSTHHNFKHLASS